jgi:peptidoglycan L-alanyl-D-glutamate endopeptidase CwlK
MERNKWGQRSLERMEGVNPLLIIFAERLLKASPYDLTIPWMGGVRTADEQKAIFEEGNSKCDGTEKRSYHQSGNAIDIVLYGKSTAEMYDAEKLEKIGEIGKQIWDEMGFKHCVLKWGGDWTSFVDRPHWEIRK